MYQFNYHKASSLADAAAALARNSDARLLAGGQTLIASMKLRLVSPPDVIDLSGVVTVVIDLSGVVIVVIDLSGVVIVVISRSRKQGRGAALENGRAAKPVIHRVPDT